MSANEQIDLLANYIMRECPHEIIDGGAGDVAVLIIDKYRGAFRAIMNELGVPNEDYPTNVANAYKIAETILNKPNET